MSQDTNDVVTIGELSRVTNVPGWWLRRTFDRGELGDDVEILRVADMRCINGRDRERVIARIKELDAVRPRSLLRPAPAK